jgi:8-oxo-dGTP pyrophosphatase MutT (NUDIX family)
MHLQALPETKIHEQLAVAVKRPLENPYPPSLLTGRTRNAAVLIPFLVRDGRWQILFIRRTKNEEDRHGGQVAFPGGRADPGDIDPEATAQREAQEEIGLNPSDVRVLGRLNDILTISNYKVTPVIGVIPWPYALNPAPQEVDRVFTIPLDWLADPKNRTWQKRRLPPPFDQEVQVIYFRPFDGELLWGASARIMVNLLQVLLN